MNIVVILILLLAAGAIIVGGLQFFFSSEELPINHSLILRVINIPDQLKDEVVMMIEG